MSNIPAPFVFIGFNKKAVENLFYNNLPLKKEDLIKEYSGDSKDYLLFSNYANPNIISLEHTLMGGNSWGIKIEFIDPNNEFESKLIGSSFYPEALSDVMNPSTGIAAGLVQNSVITEEYRQKLKEEKYGEYIKSYRNANLLRKYYIAYGVGTDINDWAGPFECEASKIDVDINEFKKITLMLVPTKNLLSLSDKQQAAGDLGYVFNYYGMRRSVNGTSVKFTFNEFLETTTDKIYGESDSKDQQNLITDVISQATNQYFKITEEENKRLSKIANSFNYFDFHQIVTDSIKDFIRKVTGRNNVLVLMPNLNLLLLSSKMFDPVKIGQDEINKKYSNLTDSRLKTAIELRTQLNYLLNLISISLDSFSKGEGPTSQDFKVLRTGGSPTAAIITEIEKTPKPDARVRQFFKDNDIYACVTKTSDENSTIDYASVLNDIISDINLLNGTYSITPTMVYENNPRIIRIWKDYYDKKDPLFWSKNITNPEEPWVVFGDSYLVSKALYGGAKSSNGLSPLQIQIASVQLKETQEQRDAREAKIKELQAQQTQASGTSGQSIASQIQTLQNFTVDKNAKTYGTVKVEPVHNSDKVILSKEYNEKILALLYPDSKNSAFGSVTEVPDEFAYSLGGTEEEQKDLLKGMPIFRFNTVNPNVLKIKIDINTLYQTELQAGFLKELDKRAVRHLAGPYSESTRLNPFLSEAAIIQYVGNKLQASQGTQEARNDVARELAENFAVNGLPDNLSITGSNYNDIAMQCIAMAEIQLQNPNGVKYFIDVASTNNAPNIMFNLANQVHNKILTLSVETVPFFFLANNSVINSDCLLFAKAPEFTGVSKPPKNSKFLDLVSGMYKIMGFKHTISDSQMKSEFFLAKAGMQNTPPSKAVQKEASE